MPTPNKTRALEALAKEIVKHIRIDTESLGHDWDSSEWEVAEQSAIRTLSRELAEGEPAPTPERNLTDRQKEIEEAAGMSLDWGMANDAQVAAAPTKSEREVVTFENWYGNIWMKTHWGGEQPYVRDAMKAAFEAALAAAPATPPAPEQRKRTWHQIQAWKDEKLQQRVNAVIDAAQEGDVPPPAPTFEDGEEGTK